MNESSQASLIVLALHETRVAALRREAEEYRLAAQVQGGQHHWWDRLRATRRAGPGRPAGAPRPALP